MDFKKMFKTEDCTSKFKESDIEQNKVLSLFSYLGILFLIPLLACKDSNYAKFHINQGLKLWIVSIAIGVVSGLISFVLNILLAILGVLDLPILSVLLALIMIPVGLIMMVVGLGIFVINIIGIVNAVSGKAKTCFIVNGINFDIVKYE